MIWVGLIIGFVISVPLGYFLGRRNSTKAASKPKPKKTPPKPKPEKAVPKKTPPSFIDMMEKTWQSQKERDPELAAEVDADIERQFRDLE